MSVSLARCVLMFDRSSVHYLLSESGATVILRRARKVLGGLEARPFITGDGCVLL